MSDTSVILEPEDTAAVVAPADRSELPQGVILQRLGRPLRVMQIMTRLAIGGAASHAIFLAERFQAPDFETRLLVGRTEKSEGSMEQMAEERGVTLTRIYGLGREVSMQSDLHTLQLLYREMRRFRPDIVHTHLSKAGALGRVAARLARVPAVVHTYHNNIFQGYFSKSKSALFLQIERALAQITDRLIVLGEGQERELLQQGIGTPARMVRVPLGLELGPFLRARERRGELRRELRVPDGIPLVGIVARLVPIKAHDLFLEAARRVALSLPETQFVLVGDGELREELEEKALSMGFLVLSYHPGEPVRERPSPCMPPISAYAAPVVHFVGFRSDLPPIYADLNVLVLCSISEGLPVSIIEALASGCPVVSTEVGAIRDLIIPGETGILVRPGDVEGLARGILEQLQNRTRTEAMIQRGRDHVYPRLSVERLEQDIRKLYCDLAERKGILRAG
ncbi:MAG: glycosyltransferase [Chloroherpetonaceae bacterium]|nr:glycosyltransferase [Chloroherpetonaceae bacterium]